MENTAPHLPYLEFHITDHCNLNCKGCTHFSPLAAEYFLILEDFMRDMQRLSEIFPNIDRMRILGGEPLLHPSVSEFIETAHHFFPQSNITLVTNGILLPSMNAKFYETLKNNNVSLDITVYPLTRNHMPAKIALAEQYGIPIEYQDSDYFCRFLNANGDSDKEKSFKQCWVNYCSFLRKGKIFPCCLPALADTINKAFGWNIPTDGYIDIHTNVSAQDILDFLGRPISACAYCAKATWFPWALSQRQPDEWTVIRTM